MNKFRELLPLPSDAVKAMIDGLEAVHRGDYPNFFVNMGAFGEVLNNNACAACAATVSAMHLLKRKLDADTIQRTITRAHAFGLLRVDLTEWEETIDDFRKGNHRALRKLYSDVELDKDLELPKPIVPLMYLQIDQWVEELETFKLYYEQLKEMGL